MGIDMTQDYTIKMRALFNKRALYSDETEMYQSPNETGAGRYGACQIPDPAE